MIKPKLISFEIEPSRTTDSAKELAQLIDLHKSGQPVSLEDWQRKGVPVSNRLIGKQIAEMEFIRSLGEMLGGEKKVTKEITISAEEIIIPEMVEVPRKSFSVMQSPVLVRQYRKFFKETESATDYTGKTLEILKKERGDRKMDHISLADGHAFARWLSEITGRKYDIPEMGELRECMRLVGGQLETGAWHEYTSTLDFDNGLHRYYQAFPVGRDWGRNLLAGECKEGVFLRLIERKRKD